MHNSILMSLSLATLLACGTANGTKTQQDPPVDPTATAKASVSNDLPDPIATVNGEPISAAEFNKEAAAAVIAAEVAVYEARKQALDKMVTDKLLKVEADKAGLEVEAYLTQEIESKTTPPTDAEVEAFYNEKKAEMPAPLDQMRPRLHDYLLNEKRRATFLTFIEDLKKKGKVETYLPPYRVTVGAGGSYRKGSESAPIQIVEFSDFQCPYCTRAIGTVDQVVGHYGDKVSVVFRHFPLGFHDDAHLAAQASECAGDQGKFWEYHDTLFENQRALKKTNLSEYAVQLGLNAETFDKCINEGTHAGKVDKDMEDGSMVGMNGTPGFYINGIPLTGAVPFESFKTVIDAELARLGK